MITVELIGRLGNQMFEYAACRSVAEHNGYAFHIDSNKWLGHGLFNCSLGRVDGAITNKYSEQPGAGYNPNVFNLPDFTSMEGYFQSDKYSKRDDVKAWFAMKYGGAALNFLSRYPVNEFCYINVRGTDQCVPTLTLPQEYYNNAMAHMLSIKPDLKFVVLTDDVPFAKKYFPSLPVYSNDRDTDFYLLNAAKYNIIALSTFAWWAAYLQDDNYVIGPSGWFNWSVSREIFVPYDINTNKFIWM